MKTKVLVMPLHIGDYLADTGHLTTSQHGAYLLLMMHHYRVGHLPNCDKQLAAITKMTPAKWKKNREILLNFFEQNGEILEHKRIKIEIEKIDALRKKASEKGKLGGRPASKEKATAFENESQTKASIIHNPYSIANKKIGGNKIIDPVAPSPLALDAITRETLLLEFPAEVVTHYEALCAAEAASKGLTPHSFAARVKTFILRDRAECRGLFKPPPEPRKAPGESDRSRAAERKIFKADRAAPKAVAGLVTQVLGAK